MVYDARPAHEAAAKLPRFEFIGIDGETYSLPNLRTLTAAQGEAFQNGDTDVLREVAPEAYPAIMALRTDAGRELAEAWILHSGELGK